MKAKMTSLFVGMALLAGVGIANAEERLSAASMDGVTAGTYDVDFSKYISTNVFSVLNQYKNIYSNTYVNGQLSEAEAVSKCYSGNCMVETLTVTETSDYGSTAVSGSIASTN